MSIWRNLYRKIRPTLVIGYFLLMASMSYYFATDCRDKMAILSKVVNCMEPGTLFQLSLFANLTIFTLFLTLSVSTLIGIVRGD